MNTFTLGVRNAFRNATRSLSIVIILGLSIGLCLTMLIAHQAVGTKIANAKSSIGNTITISPAGFNQFSTTNNALTTTELNKVKALTHITDITESLTDRLTTNGASSPSFGPNNNSSSTAKTSLTSPVTLSGGGHRAFFGGLSGSVSDTSATSFSLPITIEGTTNPASVQDTTVTISSGSAISGTANSLDTMISTQMASKNNLKVGSTFTAYGKALTVAALFKTSDQAAEDVVVVSLPTEQSLSSQSGVVTSATATVDSVDNLSSATTAIKNMLGSAADVTNSQSQVDQAVAPLNNVKTISLYSLIGAVVAGSVIILLTMIMIVRERRREIGILKAIGASNTRIIFQFMSEALTFTVLGAIIGLIIGVVGGSPVTNTLVSNASSSTTPTTTTAGVGGGRFDGAGTGAPGAAPGGGTPNFTARPANGGSFFGRNTNRVSNSIRNVHANVGWSVLAYGLGAAIIISAVGSAFAGWLIARVRPSEVMRAD